MPGVIADPDRDLAGEFGCLGRVAVSGITCPAAAFVESDQRLAFRLTGGTLVAIGRVSGEGSAWSRG